MGLRLEYKASGTTATAAESGVLEADAQTGIVEAIVSVTGVVDEDNDEVLPGAYAETLKKRTPKGIFHHDWRRWVARTLDIKELLPGDPQLPKTTRSGEPWPQGAGALWVKAQFNLGTTEGKEAFSNVDFFADETEWSIGYKVRPGNARKTPAGVRRIKAVDLYEYSPVLFGAAPLSGTLSVKELTGSEEEPEEDDEAEEVGDGPAGEEEEEGGGPDEAALHSAVDAAIDGDEDPPEGLSLLDGVEPAAEPADEGDSPDVPPGMSLLDLIEDQPAPTPAAGVKHAIPTIDLDEMRRGTQTKAGTPGVADTPSDEAAVQRLKSWYVRGEGAARIRWGQPGDFMRCVQLAGKHMTPDKAKGFCANRHKEAVGSWPGQEGGKGAKGLYDPELEVGADAGHLDPDDPDGLQTKTMQLAGTWEDLRDKLRQAVEERYVPRREPGETRDATPVHDWVCIEGTWADRVVITHEHGNNRDSYSIPYTVTPLGDIMLGESQPVTITVTPVITAGAAEAALAGKADALEHLARAVQADVGVEVKAGRVFSSANEARFRQIMTLLLDAFKSAGIDVLAPPPENKQVTADRQPAGESRVRLSSELLQRRRAVAAFTRERRQGAT